MRIAPPSRRAIALVRVHDLLRAATVGADGSDRTSSVGDDLDAFCVGAGCDFSAFAVILDVGSGDNSGQVSPT